MKRKYWEMLKKKKFWIGFILSIVVVVILGLGFAGNYLINYALVVDENGNIGSMNGETYQGHQDTEAQEYYDNWIKDQKINEWTIKNDEGNQLWAQIYEPKQSSNIYVLAVHGYTADHRDIAPAIVPFVEKGWNVVAIDQRGRGNSEGNLLTMGFHEKDDVLLWAKYICQQDPNAQIVLYGESMGAATIMMAAGETDLPKQVVAVVEDCGYTSAYAMFKDQLKERFGLAEFPFLPAASLVGQFRFGFDFYDANVETQLQKAKLPILFIHGGDDDYVPTYMGKALYENYQNEKELLIIDGAGHGQSSDVNPEKYYQTIFDFLKKYM